jgi:hypothetical protein
MTMNADREHKKNTSFQLSDGTVKIIKSIGKEDGCSEAEVVTVAVATYRLSRNMLDLLLHNSTHLEIADGIIEKDDGVYQDTVKKCHKFMASSDRDNRRRKGEVVKLMLACEYHLDNDLCTPEEREEFTRYLIWIKNKLPEL